MIVNMGDEEPNLNGHKATTNSIELIETIKSLRMEVESYKVGNREVYLSKINMHQSILTSFLE